jgi:hypothetical protein
MNQVFPPLAHAITPLLQAKYNGEAASPGVACQNWKLGVHGAGHCTAPELVAIVLIKTGFCNLPSPSSITSPAAGFIKSP